MKTNVQSSLLLILCLFFGQGITYEDIEESIEAFKRDAGGALLKKSLQGRDVNNTITFAQDIYKRLETHELILGYSEIEVQKGSPSHGEYIDSFPEPEAEQMMRDSLVVVTTSALLVYDFCGTKPGDLKKCGAALKNLKLWKSGVSKSCNYLGKKCEKEEIYSKYRMFDGSCNNADDGGKGSSFTVYHRLLYPNFMDGIRQPRRSVTREPLTSANSISSNLYLDPTLDKKRSLAVLYWGQFIEHDLSHTAMSNMVHTKKPIECCSPEGWIFSPRKQHEFCFPIQVPFSNDYYTSKDMGCISYIKSMPGIGPDCSLGPLQQINQATHFLDGSQIYGATARQHKIVRNYTSGLLNASFLDDDESFYLPLSNDPENLCQTSRNEIPCFQSGDKRVNLNPYITTLYTLWMREHNRIATELKIINPKWNSETLFQEARRIVIAEMQHITYSEWIPSVLGEEIDGVYDPTENPVVSNAFATAGVRAIQSAGSGKLSSSKDEKKFQSKSPKDVDRLLKEMASEHFRGGRLQYIGKLLNTVYGYDILSIDIQRGRDHGLPTYNEYRKLCGMKKASSFQGLIGIMLQKSVESLQKSYKNVEDIDLIVGGLAEVPSKGLFGPTITCILENQFKRTRMGDRYFYTNENQPSPFSISQLEEIKKVTLARIICENTDKIDKIQPRVFEVVSQRNSPDVLCTSKKIPKINLDLWGTKRLEYS